MCHQVKHLHVFQSAFIVTAGVDTKLFQNFADQVKERAKQPPFNYDFTDKREVTKATILIAASIIGPDPPAGSYISNSSYSSSKLLLFFSHLIFL